eukprot:5923151-Pyramimonas_sp.AAC.1
MQLRIDDEKARFQVFVRRPNPELLGTDFAWDQTLAMRAIGGHTAVHRNSQPWNVGWMRLSWTDMKYLHHATTRDAWTSIRNIGAVPGYGADRHTPQEAFYSTSSVMRYDTQNPHCATPGYKFEHKKKQVDVVIGIRSAMSIGCDL